MHLWFILIHTVVYRILFSRMHSYTNNLILAEAMNLWFIFIHTVSFVITNMHFAYSQLSPSPPSIISCITVFLWTAAFLVPRHSEQPLNHLHSMSGLQWPTWGMKGMPPGTWGMREIPTGTWGIKGMPPGTWGMKEILPGNVLPTKMNRAERSQPWNEKAPLWTWSRKLVFMMNHGAICVGKIWYPRSQTSLEVGTRDPVARGLQLSPGRSPFWYWCNEV